MYICTYIHILIHIHILIRTESSEAMVNATINTVFMYSLNTNALECDGNNNIFSTHMHMYIYIYIYIVWRHHQLLRHFEDRGNWWTFAKKREVR